MKKLIPADTVDAAGFVWETTGENIRRGAKEFSEDIVKNIVDALFPVGSVYCGENSTILSIGTWNRMSLDGIPIISTAVTESGNSVNCYYIAKQESAIMGLSLRMWRRVS